VINAGELRSRVTLQTLTRTRTAGGGYTDTATDIATVWARVRALQGSERQRAMQNGAVNPYEVQVRYRAGLNSTKRVIYHHPDGDRTLNIRSVYDPTETREELLMDADQA
jgi:SPP1 family predicted phage head-tail adaptor